MIFKPNPFRSPLADFAGHSPFSDDEIATLRRRAWTEQGLFIVQPWDRRLSPVEAVLIRDIAERLYGDGGAYE